MSSEVTSRRTKPDKRTPYEASAIPISAQEHEELVSVFATANFECFICLVFSLAKQDYIRTLHHENKIKQLDQRGERRKALLEDEALSHLEEMIWQEHEKQFTSELEIEFADSIRAQLLECYTPEMG